MRTCRAMRSIFEEAVQGTLSEDAAAAVRTHLDACPACRAAYEAVREAYTLLPALPAYPLPNLDALARRAQAGAEPASWGWARPALAAVVLLMLCLGGAYWFRATTPAPAPMAHRVLPPSPSMPPERIPMPQPVFTPPAPASVPQGQARPKPHAAPRPVPHRPIPPPPASPPPTESPDQLSQYATLVAEVVRAHASSARDAACAVLPLRSTGETGVPCADMATAVLAVRLQRDDALTVHRLPPTADDAGDLPTLTRQALAATRDAGTPYVVFGTVTPGTRGFDLALYVVDTRTGALLLDGGHPVRITDA